MKGLASQSELTFQLIVEAAPSAMILVNKEGKIAYLNSKTESLFGYSRNELIGQPIEILIPSRFTVGHPGLRDTFFVAPHARAMGVGRDLFALRKNGTEFPVEIGLNPLVTVDGVWVVADIIDITERKKFEEQKTLFASIVNSSEDAILSKTLEGIITSWNHGAEKLFGYASEEVIGKHISVLIPEHLRNEENEIIKKISSGESVEHYETERIRKDDKVINVSLTISPIKDSYGNIIGASKICRDITERKNNEIKIKKGNRLYAFLSEINQSIVHSKDKQMLFDKACNVALEVGEFKFAWIGMIDESSGKVHLVAQKGIAEEDFPIYDTLNYKSPAYSASPLRKAIITGEPACINNAPDDPSMEGFRELAEKRGYYSSMILPLKRYGKTVGVFSCISSVIDFFDAEEINLLKEAAGDISFALDFFAKEENRMAAEKKIEDSELSMREAQEIANLGSWELDLATGNTIWSEENCKIFGVSPEENYQNLGAFFTFVHPDDLDHVKKEIEDCLANPRDSSFYCRIIRRDGTIRQVHTKGRFRLNEEGRPYGVYGISHDVTERKKAEEELRTNNAELKKINAELDRFVYSISHELRLPLTSIMGLEKLLSREPLSDQGKQVLSFISRSVFTMDETIREILDYSRNTRMEIKNDELNLESIIEGAFENANYYKEGFTFDKRIKLIVDTPFYSDLSRIKPIVNNLVSNAIKYSKKDIPDSFIEINVVVDKQKMTLEISDNGIGVKDEYLPNIFKMFYRATAATSGSGLGLYITKECLEKLGGTISVKSEFGVGTTIKLEIPNATPTEG